MNTKRIALQFAVLLALGTAVQPAAAANRTVNERRAMPLQGEVEVINVSGRVRISTWEKGELEVTGELGSGVKQLDITASGQRTTVRVVLPRGGVRDGDAWLDIRMPRGASLRASVVAADLDVRGVEGAQDLKSISGNLVAEAGARDVCLQTVSGDVTLSGRGQRLHTRLQTISGNIQARGVAGDLEFNSVSGDLVLDAGTLERAKLNTISGDMRTRMGLAPDARLDIETVSGDTEVLLAGPVSANFSLETFSGDIVNCFGPKPEDSGFMPGQRLSFREGQGGAVFNFDTKSGDLRLCKK